jgi:uncharacterized protein (DUF58 family)
METTELLKKVRTIEIKTRGLSNHIFSGEYHSAFKGRGMSFSEVRDYQPGDDIRSIDWNVTARFNTPYVKVFEEERELTVVLLVDVSGSGKFGSNVQFKNELITELCAVIAFSAIQNNDKIGLLFFSDRIEKFIPPKKGKTHILRIIRELIEFKPESNGTNLTQALQYLNNAIKKRSIAFILSDFMDSTLNETILTITNKKHDLVALRIYDQREAVMPNVGMVNMIDAETGITRVVDTSSKLIRDNYAKYWNEQDKKITNTLAKSGVDTVKLRTDESYVQPLMNMFKRRGARA